MTRGRGELTPQDLRIRQTITNNINSLIAKSGKKQIDIHNKTGIPKSTLTGYVKGTSTPSKGNLQKIADFFGVKKSEIDPRFKSEIPTKFELLEESNITTIYNQLNKKRKDKVYTYAKYQLKFQEYKKTHQESNELLDEEYEDVAIQSKVAAGIGVTDLDPEDVEVVYRPKSSIPDNYDMAFEVSGDSMEPTFEDGEIIYVEITSEFYDGMLGVVLIDDRAFVKKIYLEKDHIRLVSLNKKYADITSKGDEQVRIVGRVISR